MRNKILLGIGALFVVLVGVYSRDLIGLYYLVDTFLTTTKAYEREVGTWPQIVDGCNGCHGAQGSSQHQRYPSLAGQPTAYVTAQLHGFANGKRLYPTMGPLAMTLNEDEIKHVADYYARQLPVENRWFVPDPSLRERGQKLAAAGACVACHGENLMGQRTFPRLAGQGVEYLQAQLDAFAEGRRVDPSGSMNAIAAALSSDDRKALSHYLAALAKPAK